LAAGVMCIPPPSHSQFATMTSSMRPCRSSSSTATVTSEFFQRANTASVAQRNDALPPKAFEVEFARLATAPLIPALAMLAK
jgi:hypothetical protein